MNKTNLIKGNFGSFLKKHRLKNTVLSLNKFAIELGISPAWLCRIETGKEKPNFQLIQKMAKLLGMDENLLAGRAGVIDPKIVKTITRNDHFSTSIPKLLDAIAKSSDPNGMLESVMIGMQKLKKDLIRGNCRVRVLK